MALCQSGVRAGYQRTAVRHKFAASIRFTDSHLSVMMGRVSTSEEHDISGHARPRSHLSELWAVIKPPAPRSFPGSGRASGTPLLGVRSVWRSRARRTGHLYHAAAPRLLERNRLLTVHRAALAPETHGQRNFCTCSPRTNALASACIASALSHVAQRFWKRSSEPPKTLVSNNSGGPRRDMR